MARTSSTYLPNKLLVSILIILFIIVLALVLHIVLGRNIHFTNSVDINSNVLIYDLEEILSFPKNSMEAEGIYLVDPIHMEKDKYNNIYISDQREHKIHVFNIDGEYINSIGRLGQGPGDFYSPTFFTINNNNTLLAGESHNLRLQLFSLDGLFINSINLFRGLSSWAMNNQNDRIYAVPYLRRRENDPLIDVMTINGIVTQSFGTPLQYELLGGILNISRIALGNNDDIYQAFQFLAKIRIYKSKGTLLKELDLNDNPVMAAKQKINIENIIKAKKNIKVGYRITIASIKAVDNGFYVFQNEPSIDILYFDSTGRFCSRSMGSLEKGVILSDFLVTNSDKYGTLYLILEKYPNPSVHVFRHKYSATNILSKQYN